MAWTCNWMIKIVKVNKLYLNSLLVSIVNRVSQSGTMKYQCEWKHRCVKQEMVTYVAKGRQPFLFSEVVQRHSGDEKVICWLNSFSQFRRTTRDWSHSCISPLTGIAPTHAFIILLYFIFYLSFFFLFCHSFWLNDLYTEIKTERAFYYVLPILIFLLTQGHVLSQ